MSGVVLSARGLAKSYGANRVLHALDLDAPAGQFVAIVGRSGCGKSTLLRLIQGLEPPTAGAIDAGSNPAARRMMFQEPRLLPWLKVVDNVEVGLAGTPDRRAVRRGAESALTEVGLGERGAEWPAALSGGQRQRVALARALVSRPRLLCLDEPFGALDALTRIEMQALLERVWTEQGFTAVLVTHDVSEAVSLGDRVLLIDAGHIALDVPVDIPRPRRRGDPAMAALEGQILDRLFAGSPDTVA